MENISRRSVIGMAAGVLAGGVLAGEQSAAAAEEKPVVDAREPAAAKTESIYKFRMGTAHVRHYGDSNVREHKLHDFPASNTMAATLINLAPGDIREPHWHPNADEWLFVMAGSISMTVVDGKGEASHFDCGFEDVAFVPVGFGHYVENAGKVEARLMLVHNNADFTTVNLSEWVAAGSANVFAATMKMPVAALDDVPVKKVFIVSKDERK